MEPVGSWPFGVRGDVRLMLLSMDNADGLPLAVDDGECCACIDGISSGCSNDDSSGKIVLIAVPLPLEL